MPISSVCSFQTGWQSAALFIRQITSIDCSLKNVSAVLGTHYVLGARLCSNTAALLSLGGVHPCTSVSNSQSLTLAGLRWPFLAEFGATFGLRITVVDGGLMAGRNSQETSFECGPRSACC